MNRCNFTTVLPRFKSAFILFVITIAVAGAACNHGTDLSGTPEMSFQSDVLPIVVSHCSFTGCHGDNGGQFPLTTYDQISKRVKPGDARHSSLYEAITVNGGEQKMPPKNYQPLSESDIATIFLWIEQGANDN